MSAASRTPLQPSSDIFNAVADRGTDLQVLWTLSKKPPPPDGRHGQAGDARNVMLVQKGFNCVVNCCHS
jgi:hypothetical protein